MILVTGASGTVGALLVEELRARDRPVRAMLRDVAAASTRWDAKTRPVVADFADPASLDAAVAAVDAIYLLAAVHPEMAAHERNVIDAAARSDARPRIVLHAAAGVDARPEGVRFLTAHARALDHLRASGLDWTVLAPNGFFQNFLGMAPSVKAGGIALPAGNAAVSYVDARDVAAVAAHVLTSDGHAGRIYPVTGPRALTHGEIAEALGAAANRTVTYRAVTGEQARDAMLAAGLDTWRVDGLVELYGMYASGFAARVSDTVPTLLRRPARSFDEFLAAHPGVFR
ncbi:MAG TPA: NAD(P)H-binding protein [Stackebrandtia sp.]|jgi:uncharacterized protein YbjT (DUF2867 family)|uniref:NAD(P)H-binding protein n=1 Tax=Stackebrandtia sp. TaxID=2023065 RepID=UPI002D28B0BE|nr:NAD(P)H-binding protein [Stackebrandtia sp.]HZE37782.1 NAD(P)H-binding protein [Stackebrandtia sp.]